MVTYVCKIKKIEKKVGFKYSWATANLTALYNNLENKTIKYKTSDVTRNVLRFETGSFLRNMKLNYVHNRSVVNNWIKIIHVYKGNSVATMREKMLICSKNQTLVQCTFRLHKKSDNNVFNKAFYYKDDN